MRRRITLTAAAAGILLLLTGCAGAIDTGTGTAPTADDGSIPRPAACDEETPYIAVALPNLTNPYYVAMKQGFEQQGEEQGFEVEVQVANDDDAAQLSQVQSMLQKQPCALALNAVKSEPAAAIVKAANDAGVPVFTVNVTVSPDALEAQGASIVQYLGADNAAGGQQMAEQVLADLGADAELNIGFVTEPDEVPTVQRDEGFEEGISSDANATVVAKVDGNVKPDDSLAATTEMLSGNPDINVIFASTGPGTYGALQGLEGHPDVQLYGFCASEEPLEGQYKGCVAQEPESYGQQVIDQIRGFVDGDTPEAEILLPLKLFVTGETPAPGEVG
ncbi:substrate-binding domain-containing protein [Microbacterium aurantiacum]|mgnify:CR=1 FL=1|uniref:Substrate-binding domain-containing protein n=1 Tax=Microbacterium aurantiacum TaxID=162393 RepID=A0AAJ2HIA0_9MICO|nr:substrate-binding domain-containing protein [Microbacterium aurantiacum]MDS0245294.1 substrate-binding domain-containing protein [Microbacterium aurantiacum]